MDNSNLEHMLNLIEQIRVAMNAQLDNLSAAVREAAPPSAPARQRRRIPYSAKIVPTDIDKAKAQAALKRIGIKP